MADPTLHSERSAAARAKIYQAALRLFADNGGAEIKVSDLAEAAGIARGTIYNNINEPERLFGDIALDLSREMIARVERTMRDYDDPVERLATGVRLFVRRAHEEHDWGRFIVRFALSNGMLHSMMLEPPARDVARAIELGRFKLDPTRGPAFVGLLTGSTLAAMNAVIRGDQAWRDAAAATAELLLRAGGVPAAEARRVAQGELPDLAPAHAARPERRKKA